MRWTLALLCLVLGACNPKKPPKPAAAGTPTGAKVSQAIGPNGGAVRSPDGLLTLEFPMGALTENTQVEVEPITNTAPLGLGGAYRLTPHGATFAQPVKLSFRYADAELAGSSKGALAVATQDAMGHWRRAGEVQLDEAGRTFSIETTHFSDYSRVLGWQLVPPNATVTPGDSVKLNLKYCEPEAPSAEGLGGLIPRCDLDEELPYLATVSGWAVNGKVGGSLGDGTVNGRGVTADYQAPLTEPAQNPVAVSCDISRGQRKELAVANVLVGAGGFMGEISWTLSGSHELTSGMFMRRWVVTGSGRIRVRPGPAGLGEVESASATYHYEEHENYANSYMAMGCSYTTTQTRKQVLSGASSTGASVAIVESAPGMAVISIGTPSGETTGTITSNSSGTTSGPPPCTSPMPTQTQNPITGAMPAQTFTFNATTTSGDSRSYAGGQQVRVDDVPTHEYSVSFNLYNSK